MATLTVGDITPRVQYTATASQTTFAYAFPIFATSDLKVYIGSTLKTLTTHYTVTGAGTSSGGNVVLGTGASAGDIVTIYRDLPVARSSDYQTGGTFRAETLNDDLDKAIMMVQQLEDQVNNNTLTVDQFDDTSIDLTLPVKDTRKGTVLGFNATTGAPEAGPTIANVNSLAAITANINTVAGIHANVTTVANNNSNVSTVAGISSNVTTVAGISSDVTAVAADATDIGVVAGKATEIGRLGTADAVADMAILGTADVVADLNTLGTADVVADLNTLGTADVVSDLNTLGTADVVADMNTLASSSNVTNMNTLAGIASDITGVNAIASNVTSVAGNATNINAVAADATDIGAVAAKATEIGRLGTADAVADMAILGTSDVVADMNTLGTSDIVTDMNLLGTSANVTNMATLGASGVVGNVATVAGVSSNVTTVAGISSDVTAVAGKATEIGRLGTADAVADMNTLGTADVVADLNTLGTADVVTDMNTLGTADNVTNMNTVADNIAGVNSFAERYRVASSAPGSDLDEGDLYFNTTDNNLYFYNGSAWTQITTYTHPNHSGEVTSTGDGATVIVDNIVDEANLKISNAGSNGQFLSKQSGDTGGLTWADVDALPSQSSQSGKYLTTNGSAASWATLDTDANTTTKGLYEHAHTIAANYAITSGNNALTAGPITINSGVSVTVPTGSTWIVA